MQAQTCHYQRPYPIRKLKISVILCLPNPEACGGDTRQVALAVVLQSKTSQYCIDHRHAERPELLFFFKSRHHGVCGHLEQEYIKVFCWLVGENHCSTKTGAGAARIKSVLAPHLSTNIE